MIVEYHRPNDIQETLDLLENQDITTVLMGGGTAIDRYKTEPMAVVDLQSVGLGILEKKGNFLEIGATVTLQSLFEASQTPDVLKDVILREATHNLRQVATVAGTLIAADGRSPFAAVMLAMDATITQLPGEEQIQLGNYRLMDESQLSSKLVTKITIPLNIKLAYEQVTRTPEDLPIVCAAVAEWPSGRIRVILGGFGDVPTLASDGPDKGGEETAARDAYSSAGDEWASAEYRMEIAPLLVTRCFSQLEE